MGWVYGGWTKEGTKIEGKEKLLASPYIKESLKPW
jgi:hypothetical protein